jgi:CheY-like chemotaxis protein
VSTLEEAETALSGRYDALLVAVRFNESRMFDLLRHVRTSGASDRLAVICYRSTPGPVTTTALALEAVKLASQALGAKAFFDFESYPDQKSGNRAIRELVGKLAVRALGKRTASALGDPALPSADTTMDIIQ